MALVSTRSVREDKMGVAALNKTKGRSYLCGLLFSVFVILASEASLFGISSFAEDYPDRPSNPLEVDAKPAEGSIAGIRLSIPHNYLSSGVHYKGEPVRRRERLPNPPRTFESEIESFSLVLRAREKVSGTIVWVAA